MADVGEEIREVTFEPIEEPAPVQQPVEAPEPEKVPA
jgi:hypothetical protein